MFLGFRNETGAFFVFFPPPLLWREMFTCLLLTVKKGGWSVEGVRRKWKLFLPQGRNHSMNAEHLWDADLPVRGCGASLVQSCVASGGFLSLSGPPYTHLMKHEIGAVSTGLSSDSYYVKCSQPGHPVVLSVRCPCAPPPPSNSLALFLTSQLLLAVLQQLGPPPVPPPVPPSGPLPWLFPLPRTLPLVSPSGLCSNVTLSVRPLSLLNSTFSTTLSPLNVLYFSS